jgi:uncharacterized protein (TIGR00730 family)
MSDGLAAAGDDRVAALLAELGVDKDLRLAEEFVSEALGLLTDRPDTLDLKIASAALSEMRDAFAMFAPYKDVRKVSIFGSARTTKDDPLYDQTRKIAQRLADAGWMVVTGAGPGIMEAGMEGAGRERSIGVSIRLPFETGANSIIAGDAKHVSMKYFFTRKLMLVKESSAFVCLPGGFGTLDETFELLTLTQTGKGLPVPIVFLDTPDDRYWEAVDQFVETHLVQRGLVSEVDRTLYTITNSSDVAAEEIERFYANYHSIRIVGEELVIRLQRPPSEAQLADLNLRFGYLATDGEIRRVEPFGIERRQRDHVALPRIALGFDRHGYASIRGLIDAVNAYAD